MNFDKKVLLSRLEQGKVITSTGCWLFSGPSTENKREIFIYHKNYLVSRVSAYIYYDFDLNSPKLICHECREANCWNPKHIYIGDSHTNQLDAVRDGTFKNANTDKTHCKHGHALEGRNLYLHTTLDGNVHRWCKACRANSSKRHRRKMGAKK